MSVEKSSLTRIKNKFRQSKNDIVQSPAINTNDLPQTMYGIITAEEWRKQNTKKMGVAAGNQEHNQDKDNVKMKKRKKKKKRKKIVLSFDLNEDEDKAPKITLKYNLSSNPGKEFRGEARLRWGNGNGISNIRWNIS